MADIPRLEGRQQTIHGHFDDAEETVGEDTRTVTAPEVQGLDDLDTLLEESTALAEARKGQKGGKKLSPLQQELLEAAQLAAEAALWEDKASYVHITAVSCSCGNHFEEFRGYYTYQERKGGGRRLVAARGKPEAPSVFISEEVVSTCHLCFTMGPIVTAADCDLLSVLGKCHETEEEVEGVVEEDEEEAVVGLEDLVPRLDAEGGTPKAERRSESPVATCWARW